VLVGAAQQCLQLERSLVPAGHRDQDRAPVVGGLDAFRGERLQHDRHELIRVDAALLPAEHDR
jgi:hypothetical protein